MKNLSLTRRMFGRAAGVAAIASLALLAEPRDVAAQQGGLGGGTVPSDIVLVGTSLTLAPFSFINERGESVGFELDILNAVGERLGLSFNHVRVPFSQNFTALNAGIFRMSAAAAFITCARLADPEGIGQFTVPTYSAGQVIATRPDLADAVNGFADLAGKRVGIESIGSTADRVVDEALQAVQFEKVVFSDNPSLFLALEQGRIDAAVQGEFSATWQTRGNPNITIAHRITETYFPVGFLFRNGDPLRDEFNRVLDDLKREGKLAEIYRQWFETEPGPDSATVNLVPAPTFENRGCS